jgi:hypothetical protein
MRNVLLVAAALAPAALAQAPVWGQCECQNVSTYQNVFLTLLLQAVGRAGPVQLLAQWALLAFIATPGTRNVYPVRRLPVLLQPNLPLPRLLARL